MTLPINGATAKVVAAQEDSDTVDHAVFEQAYAIQSGTDVYRVTGYDAQFGTLYFQKAPPSVADGIREHAKKTGTLLRPQGSDWLKSAIGDYVGGQGLEEPCRAQVEGTEYDVMTTYDEAAWTIFEATGDPRTFAPLPESLPRKDEIYCGSDQWYMPSWSSEQAKPDKD